MLSACLGEGHTRKECHSNVLDRRVDRSNVVIGDVYYVVVSMSEQQIFGCLN